MELSDKEKRLLEDQLQAEYICMNKYQAYAVQSVDPDIKNLFNMVYKQEENHANTIKDLLLKGGFQPPQQS